MTLPNQAVERTAAPRVFGEGGYPGAAFAHCRRSLFMRVRMAFTSILMVGGVYLAMPLTTAAADSKGSSVEICVPLPQRGSAEEAEMIRQWRKNYKAFSDDLVKRAAALHLDSSSLAEVLERILGARENKELALLPVRVRSERRNGNLVWVVTLRWESETLKEGMGHVRTFVFTQKTHELVDFHTCR